MGVHLQIVRKFCYLGDILNGGGGANSVSVAWVHSAWGEFKELDLDEEKSVIKAER